MADNLTPDFKELTDLCSNCDEESAIEILNSNGFTEDSEQWDNQKENLLSEFGICKECHENY